MIKLLRVIRARYEWRWVGTVEGITRMPQDDGTKMPTHTYWLLYVRGDGKRRTKENQGVYESCESTSCRQTRSAVMAWLAGGPLPVLFQSPAPDKPKPQLIAFPGGKGDAA